MSSLAACHVHSHTFLCLFPYFELDLRGSSLLILRVLAVLDIAKIRISQFPLSALSAGPLRNAPVNWCEQ